MAVNRLCAYVVSVVEREFFPNSGVIKSHGILKLRAFKTQKQAKACWERFRKEYDGKRVDFDDKCSYTRFNDVDVEHNQKEDWVFPTMEWDVRIEGVIL